MKALVKSSSLSNRFGLQQFYQDLSKVQSSLGKKHRKHIQSPMRPQRQKKQFQMNVDTFYKQKDNNTNLQKKNLQKTKLQLNAKYQSKMKSLNISQLNTDAETFERNFRQSQMPSYQMQQSLQLTQQFSNLNDYHNASLKYSQNNFSNRDLENLLSDDRLSQSSQKNCKHSKHGNILIKHSKTKLNQIQLQNNSINQIYQKSDDLIEQLKKRNVVYEYINKRQNVNEEQLIDSLKKSLIKHHFMKKIIQKFKALSKLEQFQDMTQLLIFLKRKNKNV